MHKLTSSLPAEPQLGVFDQEHEKCGGRSGLPPGSTDVERRSELCESIWTEAKEVPWVLVERVAERRHQMHPSPRLQATGDLPHQNFWAWRVLQNSHALYSGKDVREKWQAFRVGDDINARHRDQIEVNVTVHAAAGSTNV